MKNKLIAFSKRIINWIKKNKIKSAIAFLLLLIYYFSIPRTLFQEPYSTVIESKEGELLGAKIARDGQWRFPAQDSVPDKFKKCIVYFEDEYFYKHPGFNPVAMVNAIKQNRKAGKVVRGGSTLTQQVIRLSRKGKGRTYFEKFIEIIKATRLELGYSKNEILELYAAHAPFGGNVVGLEMAAWRYFGVQSNQLSWAENATLAVLPNAPSLIYPGKNQIKLLNKRNRLLLKLHNEGIIDQQTYELAIEEPLPQKPYDLPQIAPHLLQRVAKEDEGTRVKTTIDYALQNRVNQIARYYYNQYKQNEVNNLAILVIDVSNRNVMSYLGNAPTDKDHQKDVDIIDAPRSTGSILKPLLYAAMLDDGELLPNTLVADIPTQISGYTPQNFNLTFDGAVPAHRALSRSLNIPSVLMLQDFGVNKFYEELQKFKLRDINKTPDHYGLSLILGGAESNLWDLCRTYANLSSTVNYYTKNNAKYRTKEFTELNFRNDFEPDFGSETDQKNILGAGSIWLTYNAMEEVNRPEGDEAWKFYDSSLKIAWKTGTSFGNRDAWAIGTNSKYAVGIWVGNATGEGRPTLTGVTSAAPILFDVFNLLPRQRWFQTPYKDLDEVEVCRLSGYLAKEECPKIKQWVSKKGKSTAVCPYHKKVHLDKTEKFQVNSSCESIDNIVTKNWFVLPPVMAWYYKSQHIEYLPLPPFKEDCQGTQTTTMDFIYPKANSKIYLTKNFNSEVQPVILKVAYSERDKELFWYVDNVYKATTKTFHELPISPTTGIHYITVVDACGNEIRRKIEIVRE
ncbi:MULTISPECIES: penicillin-binding protein 1C [unclassified Flavobacterium]|uniref:penicillin-binding protein 1C n=1 Tax=unclassified Flavobacterium TaxID=196869 RepID=UPI0012A7F569|nr:MULTISPECIES: penicillin-binding protein 1C [unclassified Flavobacterium]MBF4484698.1 penicillin-binding protein 1C [Flavobacterium sp. CSZ]QGK75750.1 penicillin-binding protein 1C [Flavobacterium sp. SLB02]